MDDVAADFGILGNVPRGDLTAFFTGLPQGFALDFTQAGFAIGLHSYTEGAWFPLH